ncbi:MAG: Flp pilus assembly pilin Flp [Litorivivens sp.]|jgi:Flp pilus assembly pilin Flp
MPPVELMSLALKQFYLDEAGGSLMESLLLAALIATVFALIVLAIGKIF